ncbi:MAG: hypothetical protein ABR927_05935 [Bacteroidales bacterium]|jgi:hypothetical protein
MEDMNEIFNDYQKRMNEQREEELIKNSALVQNFIDFCLDKNIQLTWDNFDFIVTIGIVAIFPNLVTILNNNITSDKEDLFYVDVLENEYKKQPFASGYYYSDNYMVMAHPYFRRGHYENNNYAPRFIDIFWSYNKPGNQKYLAIDKDRVRVNVDNLMYMELDTWFGARFENEISRIGNGIVKLRPPLGLEPSDIDFFFGNTYSLDIKWSSKNGIKVFQAEEFKAENSRIIKNGKEFYPVKYLHSEFDINMGKFRHFDGAIHFYTENEYFQRRDNDLNFSQKTGNPIKPNSQKLFKINGQIETTDWVNLASHYLTGDPLIIEYFEGKLPNNIQDTVDKIIKYRQNKHST